MQHSIETTSDRDAIVLLREGDKEAFDLLFWKYNAYIYNFTLSILFRKHLAEDITQTVFLTVWEQRHSINPDKNFSAYIFTIARNLVYKETEKMILENKYSTFIREEVPIIENNTESTVDASLIDLKLQELIDQLPASRRDIFMLSRYKGLTNKEIAVMLSISEKTVETQIYRSLKFLKQNMKDYIFSLFVFVTINI